MKRCGSDSPFKCITISIGSFGSRRIGSSDQQQVSGPAVGSHEPIRLEPKPLMEMVIHLKPESERQMGCTNNVATQLGVFEFDPRRW